MRRRLLLLVGMLVVVLFVGYGLKTPRKGKGYDHTIQYQLAMGWPSFDANIKLGNPTGVDLDSSGNLIVFQRAERAWPLFRSIPRTPIAGKTILVLNRENGAVRQRWGDHLFLMPHGLRVDQDDNIWVTDVGLHQVMKFTREGKLLLKVGVAGVAGNDSVHFNKPTDVAVKKDGSFYVSDGYGNSRVIKFSPAGKFLFQWGEKGSGAGEFNIPHSICLDEKGRVYVADRENRRIQVFDSAGKLLHVWKDESFGSLCAICYDSTRHQFIAVDDATRWLGLQHQGSDVIIFDTAGKVKYRIGRSGDYTGPTCWYHDVAVDREGNLYVGDILGNRLQKFKRLP